MQIRSLKPNVTREEAIAQFRSVGPMRLMRNAALGQLRSVADAYLPFFLFRVEITNLGRSEQRLLGLDAVTGSLDLYQFERIPSDGEVVRVETRNRLAVQLPTERAGELLVAKVRRMLYSRGFFRMHDLRIVPEPGPAELYIPYWLGFRGVGDVARLSVIDAVRRRPEGAKVRSLFESWLMQQPGMNPR